MTFFANFKKSALELKSIRCLVVTAMLIALDLAIKSLTITLPFTKISFAFLAVAAIGMLYGPVVAGLACCVTDVLGMMISQQMSAFNPLFTLVEVMGGVLYGVFLYNFNAVKPEFSSGTAFFKSIGANWRGVLRIILAKFSVIVICNLIMNTAFLVLTGYLAPESFWGGMLSRVITNFIKFPIDVFLLLLTMYPIKAAYKGVFKTKITTN